jgi:hypothetical protein
MSCRRPTSLCCRDSSYAGIISSVAILLLSVCWAAAQSADAPPVSPASSNPSFAPPPGLNEATNSQEFLDQTNQLAGTSSQATAEMLKKLHDKLANAQNLVTTRQFNLAEPILMDLLMESVPEDIRKQALYVLATAVEGENDLPRAQSILAQYLERWQGDARTPEILLRQGQIFRQMGLNNLALGKFYAVMTVALSLKDDHSTGPWHNFDWCDRWRLPIARRKRLVPHRIFFPVIPTMARNRRSGIIWPKASKPAARTVKRSGKFCCFCARKRPRRRGNPKSGPTGSSGSAMKLPTNCTRRAITSKRSMCT